MTDSSEKSLRDLLRSIALEKQKPDNLTGIISGLHPLIQIGGPVFGIFLWFQSNFVTTAAFREQEVRISELSQKIDGQSREIRQFIDQRYQESISHSDSNRERNQAVISEMKDFLKTIYFSRHNKYSE